MVYKDLIKEFCKSHGLDIVRFLPCQSCNDVENYFQYRKENGLINEFEEKDIIVRSNANYSMENAKTIISIAFPYRYKIDKSSNKFCVSKYTLGEDYHKVVKKYLTCISDFIKVKLGGDAKVFVDSNSLPERYIAMKCGVGFIGKNNCIITEKYGSYVFLGEILTDLDIEGDKPIENLCGACRNCIEACPTKAINGSENNKDNNSNICISYTSQKKDLESFWFPYLKNSLWGCDICQDVCPFNEKAHYSNIVEFSPKPYMLDLNIENIISMNNEEFNRNYRNLACGWRGKNLIIRNAIICEKNVYGVVKNRNNIASPYVKSYYDRLLKGKKFII
ncbi:epoxyqueuosine reductase [Hathewaya proteolytica DSM 3090]|uniref:Epoxyqueuosine reductase n=2 Tax=Hathewaya proteolytica TaxID=29365 RepID=A0A1M6RNG5_9CLOT|nr:tRNA epoxyqueuosine(34) reductase QueG [Hathewaya proteolytica]SHK33993.1 epoxyqueuosine reductase [Hathewaya proteolytica DSM 3090]